MERVHGRDIFPVWGIILAKLMRRTMWHPEKSCEDKHLKDLKIFQEIINGFARRNDCLNTNFTREKANT